MSRTVVDQTGEGRAAMRWSGLARLPTPDAQIQKRLGGVESLPVDDARALPRIDDVLVECCQVNRGALQLAQPDEVSGDSDGPCRIRPGAETAEVRSADEMSLRVEGVVNRGMGGEEALG